MSVEVSDEGRTLARLARARTPAEMVQVLSTESNPDALVACFEASSSGVIRSLWQRLLTVGRAYEVAGHGDGVAKQLADQFKVSTRTIERLKRAYSEIAVPKLERDGRNAELLLEDRHWYDVCCELSSVVKLPAVELLEKAESAYAENPRLSASQWKRDQLDGRDEGATGAPDKAIARWLKKAAKFETGDGIEFAKNADREMLNVARDALTFAREILDELESRFAGRVD